MWHVGKQLQPRVLCMLTQVGIVAAFIADAFKLGG